MSRRYRSFSKSSMLKALSAANLAWARQTLQERHRWRPRVLLAFLLGLVVGVLL